ncbi:FtsX-like permease family protein [Rhabdothermincola sediminis]|uniref:FtsX-like permease family protein n=1 Tax=Rhabdothermincola sediminis TaxID=2751370 RepID=UPI001AA0AF4D|nr:FtsX-like permease family protein [Rhabdothermincola sediminis]
MTSPGLWLRWSWRDLRQRWLQVAAIALVIALGSGTYVGLMSSSTWRRVSYDRSYEASATHDLLVTLAEGTFVEDARLRAALDPSRSELIEQVTTRLVVPTQVDASTGGRTILVPGSIVGVDAGGGEGPPVDRLTVQEGRLFAPGEAALVIDRHFTDHHHLPPAGELTISGGRVVPYVGTGLSPQYFLVSGRGGSLFGAGGFAVAWAPLEVAQELAGRPGQVNEAGVRLAAGVDVESARAAISSVLAAELPDVATVVTPLTEEREYRILYDDIDGDQRLYNIFALMILGGAAFAAFNLTSRIVEAQRREIGVGMSLGVPTGGLAIRPLLVAFQVSALGVLFGMVVGTIVGSLMSSIIERFFPLPVWDTPFQFGVYLRGALLGLLLTFAATIYPVWRAVRVTPVEAIRTGPRVTATSGLSRLATGLPLPGDSIAQMPLRNVLRAPRRTLLTALGIAAAIATLIGVIGMIDSFMFTIDRAERELLRTNPDRMTVDLQSFTLEDAPELRQLADTPGIARLEPTLRVGGQLVEGDTRFDTLIDLVPFDSPIWRPGLVRGSLDPSIERGVVIAEKAAADLGVDVGDQITMRYPVREGLGYRWEEGPFQVMAIHTYPYRFLTFLDLAQAPVMNLQGIVNGAQVLPSEGTSTEAVQRALFEKPAVVAVEPVAGVIANLRETISQFTDVLNVIRGAVLLLALMIAFNSTSISFDERAREHATMFAFGLPARTVMAVAMVESAVIGVLATVVGVLVGVGLLEWMTSVLLPETLPDIAVARHVSPTTYLTAVVLGVAVVALAPGLASHKLRRMDISSTLRVVE